MSVTIGYKGKRVALLAYADADGVVTHIAYATHAWVSDGTEHADGVGFDELGTPYLVKREDLR